MATKTINMNARIEEYTKMLFKKHGVRVDSEDICNNVSTFVMLETTLKISRVVLRAVANHPVESGEKKNDQLPPGSQPQTFYWVCLRGQIDAIEPIIIHYSPKVNMDLKKRPNLVSQDYVKKNHEIRREAYLDFKDCVDSGYVVDKNYVVHEPDMPLDEAFNEQFAYLITDLMQQETKGENFEARINLACERGIKERFDFYCDKFHKTGNDYYLKRGYFWKNLTVETLSQWHRVLVAAVYNNWINPAKIEGELRGAYGKTLFDFV